MSEKKSDSTCGDLPSQGGDDRSQPIGVSVGSDSSKGNGSDSEVRDSGGDSVSVSGVAISEEGGANVNSKFYRLMLDAILDGYILADTEGWIRDVNPAYCAIVGRDKSAIVGRNIREFEARIPLEQVQERIERFLKNGRDRFETQHYHADGHPVDLDVSIVIVDSGEGQPLVAAFVRDITESKELARRLHYRTLELSYAQAISHVGSWTYRLSDQKIEWSDELFRIFGLQPQSRIVRLSDLYDLTHPDDRHLHDACLEQIYAWTPETVFDHYEFRIVRPSGEERIGYVSVAMDCDDEGKPYRALGTVQDVTERKKSELLIEGENAILELIATGARLNDVMYRLAVNVESMIPGTRCSVMAMADDGKSLSHLAAPSLPEEMLRYIENFPVGPNQASCGAAAWKNEAVFVENVQVDPKWGDYREAAKRYSIAACWSMPVRWSDQSVAGTFAMYFDRPRKPDDFHIRLLKRAARLASIALERDKAEREKRQAQQELLERQSRETEFVRAELERVSQELIEQTRLATVGQMSSQIAHDLRNPLWAIRNSAYFVRAELENPRSKISNQEKIEFLQMIDDEVAACDRIIGNMLEATRPGEPVMEWVDLTKSIRRAIERWRKSSSVQVELIATPEVRAFVDPDQIRRVLDNLIRNAIEAMDGSGKIQVRVGGDKEESIIEVADNGPGISAENRTRIFQMLFTTKPKGTGLGLAICRQILERHHGTIEADVEYQGGARFVIRLPLPSEPAENSP